MFYNAKNGNINIGNTDMDYISFGKGDKVLVMIPGLGDGLKTVKSTAIAIAMKYKCFAHEYKVYVFSRNIIKAKRHGSKCSWQLDKDG